MDCWVLLFQNSKRKLQKYSSKISCSQSHPSTHTIRSPVCIIGHGTYAHNWHELWERKWCPQQSLALTWCCQPATLFPWIPFWLFKQWNCLYLHLAKMHSQCSLEHRPVSIHVHEWVGGQGEEDIRCLPLSLWPYCFSQNQKLFILARLAGQWTTRIYLPVPSPPHWGYGHTQVQICA